MPQSPDALAAQELELKVEKLRSEIAQLHRGQSTISRVKDWLPIFTTAIPMLALAFAALQFTTQQQAQQNQLTRNAVADSLADERTFMGPVLDRQMNLYMSAITAAATIAGSKDESEKRKATDTFWTLYWGPLAMYESRSVSTAMIDFGNCLNAGTQCSPSDRQQKSLALATALQTDYFASWKLSPTAYAERSAKYLSQPEKP